MEEVRLTKSQKEAFEKFSTFLEDDKAKAFILKGYAGTGKTTLTNYFIKELEKRSINFYLLASTGRAAKILANATTQATKTVHSQIYTFTDINQDLDKIAEREKQPIADSSGQLLLNFDLMPIDYTKKKPRTTYYLIDEASMLSDAEDHNSVQAAFGSGKLLYDLFRYDSMGKFIFIGDACQLPPISQAISPALDADYLKQTYQFNVYEAELSQIVRQSKGNDIVVAAQRMRDLYFNPQTSKWAQIPLKGFNNIHVLSSQAELISRYISSAKKKGFNAATLICLSNKQTRINTQVIRPSFGHQSSHLEKGDLLLVTQNNLITGLMNGDLVTVEEVSYTEMRAGLTFVYVTLKELFTQMTVSQLMITDILDNNQTNITQHQQRSLILDYYFRMKDIGIKQKSEEFKNRMMTDPYLNALRAVYGYALTCHKSQGGEWEEVFLDIPRNIGILQRPYAYQWLYTAITRAKKELYISEGFWLTS